MLRENPWDKAVPRAEHDRRAREARLRLEQLELLLAKRERRARVRPLQLFRLIALSVSRQGRHADQGASSPSYQRRPADPSSITRAPSTIAPIMVACRHQPAYGRQNSSISTRSAHRKAA